jgi:hypothetical protein
VFTDLAANSDIAGWAIDPVSDLVSITRGEAITDSQRQHLAKPKPRKGKGTALALQLHYHQNSEFIGTHDLGYDEWWRWCNGRIGGLAIWMVIPHVPRQRP